VLEAESAQLVDGVGARLERSSDDDHANLRRLLPEGVGKV
jgi:hypothetical protein